MIFKTLLARENWETKYRFGDETPLETFQRVARALAEVERSHYEATEKEVEVWYDRFLKTLVDFKPAKESDKGGEDFYVDLEGERWVADGLKCTTGGRITANAGTIFDKATLLNCFINSPVSDAKISYAKSVPNTDAKIVCDMETDQTPDSLTNIFLSLLEAADTLKSEGGYGINFGFIRPRGTLIKGVGIRHPGVVSYMELWDKMSAMIVKGDNDGYEDRLTNHLDDDTQDRIEKVMPRKGAMLAALPIWHPDIEEFVRAKQESGKLTKFNISVLVDDAFMEAVENDTMYDLHFEGKTYKQVKAVELYDLIMESTYNRAEPGVLFFDNMNRQNPLVYLGPVTASNPCVAKGTLVATEKGLVPVEDVKVGDKIQTSLGFDPVQEIEVHEDCPVYLVKFSDGTSLRVTEGHIFHVMQNSNCRKKWDNTVRLKDLKVGDYVRKQPYRFKTTNRIDLTRNDGFLAGYWLGDGCRSELKRFILSANSVEDNSYLTGALEKAGMTFCEDHSAEGNAMHLRVQSKAASEFFEKVGLDNLQYSHEKCPPEWWLNSNSEFLSGVLDGLISSDGNVNRSSRYPSIRFKSTSQKLHNFFREVCLISGADYKLYEVAKAGDLRSIYGREVVRNHDVYEGHLTNDCIEAVYRFTGGISHPDKHDQLESIVCGRQLTGTKWKVKIESIELDGKDTVYDLYEPKSDDWNTHGIVSRGCGEIPGTSYLDKGYKPAPYLEPYMGDFDNHLIGFTTVCLLGSVNLTRFVRDDRSFDYEGYRDAINTFARMLDNVNDIGAVPLPAYDWALKNIRQYGMGVNGLGSAMFMMGIRYGGDGGNEFVRRIQQAKDDETLRASALLARERGPFPMYEEKYLDTPYFKDYCTAADSTKELVRQYGLRNAKRLTNPPLGNSSVICDMVSNGIEPVFSFGYDRTVISDKWPHGLTRDNVKDILEEVEVGDSTAWRGEYNGRMWHYEPHNRGLCFVEKVQDYGYSWVLKHFPNDIDQDAEYLSTAQDLKVNEHVQVQALIQESCDQSVSKTCNLPKNYPFDEFKDLYVQAWKAKLVGFTTYRDGIMENVLAVSGSEPTSKSTASSLSELLKERGLLDEDAEITDEGVIVRDTKLPPKFSNGDTVKVKAEGNKYYLHLSYLPDDDQFPIAFWVHTNDMADGEYVSLNRAVKSVTKLLIGKGVDFDLVYEQLEKIKDDLHHVRLCKMIGMALRHNIGIVSVVHALTDIEGDYIASTLTAARKFLTSHIEDGTVVVGKECEACGSPNLIYEGGCDKCLDCGNGSCG